MKKFFKENILTLTRTGIFTILLVLGILFGNMPFVIIAASLALISVFEKYLQIKIPNSFSMAFVIFMILSLILGSYANFYEKFLWWDDMLHFGYGIGFAIIGYLCIYFLSYKKGIQNHILIIVAFSFCFSVAFGAVWEIYEYAMDTYFGMNMQRAIPDGGLDMILKEDLVRLYGVQDTMHDIILETSAAFFTNIFVYFHLKNQENNWIGRLTKAFLKENK